MPRINRRHMLQSGALASVFAASGGPLLARGKRGGRLRAALSGATPTDSWDMRVAPGLFMLAAGQGAVFECLTEVGADGALKPELARRWQTRDEALTWDIALRDDVVFHDGRAFGAADVVATFEAHGAVPQMLAQVARIETLGPHEVRMHLRAPNPNFPYELSHPQLAIQPDGAYGSGIGTGLYAVRHFAPGARFLGTRVADHWKGETAGFAQEVEFIALATPREHRAALKSGVVDVASDLGLADGLRGVRVQAGAALTRQVVTPEQVGASRPMDDARFAQRWWMA